MSVCLFSRSIMKRKWISLIHESMTKWEKLSRMTHSIRIGKNVYEVLFTNSFNLWSKVVLFGKRILNKTHTAAPEYIAEYLMYLWRSAVTRSSLSSQVHHMPSNIFWCSCVRLWKLNTLRPRQNGRHNTDDNFRLIFLNENVKFSTKISLKFVPKGPIDNIPALVKVMAWRRSCVSLVVVSLLTHICVTRPQWVNTLGPRQNCLHFDIFKCIFLNENTWIWIKISLEFAAKSTNNNMPALIRIMAWCRPSDRQLSESMMVRLRTHTCVTRSQQLNDLFTKPCLFTLAYLNNLSDFANIICRNVIV